MSKDKHNPFKMREESMLDVPSHMKNKVMSDVAAAKLVMEMATLFTCSYRETINEIFKIKS